MIKSAFIFIASIIGAAFASGKEIELFFKNNSSFNALILSIILFFLVPLKIYFELIKNDITDYKIYIEYKFKSLSKHILLISTVFSISIYVSMISGAEEIIKYGGAALSLLSLLIFITNTKGIEILSVISTPLLIFGILINCTIAIETSTFLDFKSYTYSFYNILSCLPVMCVFTNYFKNKKQAIVSTLISGTTLSVLMLCIYYVLPDKTTPMPMLNLAISNGIGVFYKIILFLAIFTTSVSSGFGFIHSVNLKRNRAILILLITGLCFLVLGFEKIVSYITTVFGILGTIIIIYITFSV